ncbi:hypothetical protein AGLY_013078 [Aphis glycines]|uniref:Uncharacterized protein n=1 Tax=Aphis glycines TaxID=307491 RepID=A0A6G0T7U3_APHGL|nr:hypothetical protein AGLY_013078 [Aphis glycines]
MFLFSGPQQQQPPSSSPAVVPCHRGRRADEEEGEDRHRHRTSAVVVPSPPNGGGRNGSSAANPEQSARSRTHRTDETHALYAAAKAAEDEVRRLTRGRLPLPTTTIDSEAALDYRRRRYGMYATATVTADDRYGHRYGLSSGLMTQDPKTSSAAAAFFLRLFISDINEISGVGCIFLYAFDSVKNVGHPVKQKTTCFKCSEAKKKNN